MASLFSLHKHFLLCQKVLDPIGGLMIVFHVTRYAFLTVPKIVPVQAKKNSFSVTFPNLFGNKKNQ